MPYPHVTQFETLDRRRQLALETADVPVRASLRPARPRLGALRLWRLAASVLNPSRHTYRRRALGDVQMRRSTPSLR
jgi:hypothetical protein